MERVLRPQARVLPDKSLVPDGNLISPPPNRFTHKVISRVPFYFDSALNATTPDGYFDPGAKVTLLVDAGGGRCRVVDGQGVYVEIDFSTLEPL